MVYPNPAVNVLNINSNLDFGRVPLSIPTDKNISLANIGDSNLIINQIVYESSLLSGSLEASFIPANVQDTEMTVTFTPESLGQFSSSILINHNGTPNPVSYTHLTLPTNREV